MLRSLGEDTMERGATVDAPAVEAVGVRKTFDEETAPIRALRGADLVVNRGDFVALMGPSASGKSTLLNILAGLDTPSEGIVSIAGSKITGLDEDGLAAVRREHVGLVFQFFNLIESLTVLENAALPALAAGLRRRAAEARASELLDLLGLSGRGEHSPAVLSGGERQRLAIARALANQPTIVMADEPTGALDSDGAEEITELFRRLNADGQTLLVVTHDDQVAAAASRVVEIRDGTTAERSAAENR
jgi:putative ABC transport system ATP-binding protein